MFSKRSSSSIHTQSTILFILLLFISVQHAKIIVPVGTGRNTPVQLFSQSNDYVKSYEDVCQFNPRYYDQTYDIYMGYSSEMYTKDNQYFEFIGSHRAAPSDFNVTHPLKIQFNEEIIDVVLGVYCFFFITNTGKLLAQGTAVDCGLNQDSLNEPTQVPGVGTLQKIVTGSRTYFALGQNSRTLWIWGQNYDGEACRDIIMPS